MSESSLQFSLTQAANSELCEAMRRIRNCVSQLNEEQLWWRCDDSMNSIANLLLHLSGNVRQWIIAGVGCELDLRKRQAEFDARGSESGTDLMKQIDDTVARACEILSQVSEDDLVRVRTIQDFQVSGSRAILHSVAHFQGHTQEIVHITRRLLGEQYEFYFVPNERQC
ncbi:MAG: DUF1572 family protein [Pirellulaceae bacterium]|nr:DUF1572 family protein [Pirellulaceae bacterium]